MDKQKNTENLYLNKNWIFLEPKRISH